MAGGKLRNNPKGLHELEFVAHAGDDSLFGVMWSYEEAVNVLYKAVSEHIIAPDLVCMPLLFLMRHCLELGYKATLEHLHKLGQKAYSPKSHLHHLRDMHKALKVAFESFCDATAAETSNFYEYYSKTTKGMNLLSSLDEIGTGFRYPDLSNKRRRVNLLEIKEAFDEAMVLLKTTADVFPDPSEFR
jgi:hypothetical protein